MSVSALIEAVKAEGSGRRGVVAAAFGDVQVAGVFASRLIVAVGRSGQDGVVTQTLEWWPDYGGGPLWKASGRGGQQVDGRALDLPVDLAAQLATWNRRYAEDKLPVAGEGDPEWLEEGIRLLAEVRRCLAGRFDVAVSEPWWGEELHG